MAWKTAAQTCRNSEPEAGGRRETKVYPFSCELIRLSRQQMQVQVADLKPVVCGELTLNSRFQSLAEVPGLSPEGRSRQLELDRQFRDIHEAILAFWRRLNSMSQSAQPRYRSHVDLFEASLCVMALRLGLRRRQRPDPASAVPNSPLMKRRREHLLRTFTNLARRLERKLKADIGEKDAAEVCRVFADRRKTISNILFHHLSKWAHSHGLRRVYQTELDDAVELAVQGLYKIGIISGDKKQLRPIVRDYLHYCRRGRTGVTVCGLFRDKVLGRLRLAAFVQDYWAKREPKSKQDNKRRKNGKTPKFARKAA